ncbi:hypothetical protein E5288_WYG018514 [Bos mutus]|uniref:G-protein coupled receptor 133 n=1 Tax=Bos mutus TaxID=72004 RepID=A0A6B0RV32_9CETA|nr:hypothetical protein [Bos mutus]
MPFKFLDAAVPAARNLRWPSLPVDQSYMFPLLPSNGLAAEGGGGKERKQMKCRDKGWFEVLASASHYWPLENVDGIHELQETTGDIVEGKVNKGIYLKEGKGVTFLYYRKNKTSCISNPAQCGPEGVSFSFFWKTQGEQSTSIPSAYGGQVISNGFKVCSRGGKGSVELYTHNKSVTWEASFSPPGHYWTHVLFTWKSEEGLKVYVNGTLRTSDPSGKASPAYGESNDNLVLDLTKSYENRAFDEFIIWERALTPDEIAMYFTAAIGEQLSLSSTSPSFSVTPTVNTMAPTDAYHPIITNLTEERKNFRRPGVVLSYLQNMSLSLPNKSLSEETAFNLTKDSAVVPGLIDTIDTVMSHITYNLQASKPQVAIVGSSSMADFSVAKVLPKTMNSSHYRFPARGQNYIEIPHEAFHSQAWTTIVGLLYHSVHYYLSNIQPASTNYLISLEVSPTPKLSQNLSGSPLITVHLRHHLTQRQYTEATNESNRIFLYCAFLDFSSGEGIWSNQGCALTEGNLSYSICRCTHLTNFAILMQVVPLELTRGHQVALSSISYIGCSLSVLCLAITLVTFAVLSSVSTIRNQRYHIHANLSCAVLVAQVLLLISFRFEPGTDTEDGAGEAVTKDCFPLLICIISIVFAMDSYGTSKNCWLSLGNGAIWAFVAPALFIIVVNIGILIAVTRVISQISAKNYKIHGDPSAFKLTAKAVAVLLPILGTSWVFGVLAVNNQAMVFQYMFAILNSLQGFFIFLFHCLLNSEVRAAFKHKTKVWSLTSSSSRQANVKPFSSDIMNGTRPATGSTRLSPWDKSSHSGHRVDLSAV